MSTAGMLAPYGLGSIAQIAVRNLGATGTDGDANHNFYHLRPTWNSTGEYLMVIHTGPAGGYWTIALHHGLTGAWIKDIYTTAQYDWRGCWSKTLPNIWYMWAGAHVYVRDVETNTNIQDFNPYTGSVTAAGPTINLTGDRIFIPMATFTPAVGHLRTFDLQPNGTIATGGNETDITYDRSTGSPIFPPNLEYVAEDKFIWARDGNKLTFGSNTLAHSGTTQAGSSRTEIHLGTGASTISGTYVGNCLQLRPTPWYGQLCPIVAYDGPNQRATVSSPGFVAAPGSNVSYTMISNNLTVMQPDGTLIRHFQGVSIGHSDYCGGNYPTLGVPIAGDVPLRIWMWKENSSDGLLVYEAGGKNTTRVQKVSNFHVGFGDYTPNKLFVSVFPYYGAGFYPYPGGTYVPNVGGAWNSADSEANIYCPYDEIFTLTTSDNWATQGGVTVEYLCRTLTRSFNPPESFWCQPQHAVNKYGTRIHFNARDET